MIIELAMVAQISFHPVELAKSSGGRSSSGSSRSSAPKSKTSEPNKQVTENKPATNNNKSNNNTQNSTSNTPKKAEEHKGKLNDKDRFSNKDGKQVIYRESGINWFQTWFLFGWLWHNPDNDKCYDNDHKAITCERKKQ